MIEGESIHEAITSLQTAIANASRSFDDYVIYGNEWATPDWAIEKCFIKLLAIIESLGLSKLHEMVSSEYLKTKETEKGFLAAGITPDGEPFSNVLARLRQFFSAVQQFYPSDEPTKITKDLLQIIRDIHYTITNKELFGSVPQNEKDVHLRIEGILKCVFPDLKHKPTLTKAIKNFEPDTGIPSIETLIEYKFLSRPEDVGTIADEILADTRGYYNFKEWKRCIYVIYETKRFRRENEWNQLLKQSGIPENMTVVVLSGEPPAKAKKKKVTPKKA
jgi:hypothetical protein